MVARIRINLNVYRRSFFRVINLALKSSLPIALACIGILLLLEDSGDFEVGRVVTIHLVVARRLLVDRAVPELLELRVWV